jgi:hypothetical protein
MTTRRPDGSAGDANYVTGSGYGEFRQPEPRIASVICAERGFSPRTVKLAWLRRQRRRAVISVIFNRIYRCLGAAGAIEDLDAAAAYHLTEWPPRNIVVAP